MTTTEVSATGSETITGTTKELCEHFGVEYPLGYNFINFLVVKGVAKKTDERKAIGGKGKPSSVWTLPRNITIEIKDVESAVA